MSKASLFTECIEQALLSAFRDGWPEAILVALSGGPDSTALLCATCEIGRRRNCRIDAIHINHGLRGAESDQDESFCRQLCDKLGIRLSASRLFEKEKPGHAPEEQLRDLRYRAIEQVAASSGSRFCLTGHTRDDQLETVLFRIFRGTGPAGLRGIPAEREYSANLTLVRPMLELTREQCLDYLKEQGVGFRQDSSNDEQTYTRNFLRHSIIPALKDRFSGLAEHVEHLRLIAQEDDGELHRQAAELRRQLAVGSGLDLENLRQCPNALKRRIIMQELEFRNIELSYFRVDMIMRLTEGEQSTVSVTQRWDARSAGGLLAWIDKTQAASEPASFDQALSVPGTSLVPQLNMAARIVPQTPPCPAFPDPHAWQIFADLSRTEGALRLRLRQPGDRIHPLGMNTGVRLKQYLHTHKSPATTIELDGRLVVLADDKEVLWVPGLGISKKIAVTGNSIHRISLTKLSLDQLC